MFNVRLNLLYLVVTATRTIYIRSQPF